MSNNFGIRTKLSLWSKEQGTGRDLKMVHKPIDIITITLHRSVLEEYSLESNTGVPILLITQQHNEIVFVGSVRWGVNIRCVIIKYYSGWQRCGGYLPE